MAHVINENKASLSNEIKLLYTILNPCFELLHSVNLIKPIPQRQLKEINSNFYKKKDIIKHL